MERPNYHLDIPRLLEVRVDEDAQKELCNYDLNVLSMIHFQNRIGKRYGDNKLLCEALKEDEIIRYRDMEWYFEDGDESIFTINGVAKCLGKLMVQDCIRVDYFINSKQTVIRSISTSEKTNALYNAIGSINNFDCQNERFRNAPSSVFTEMNIKPDLWQHRNWYLFDWDEEDILDFEKIINNLEAQTSDSMEYEECETRAKLNRDKKPKSEKPLLTYEVYKSEIDQSTPLKVRNVEDLDEFTRYYFYKHGYRLPYELDISFRDCAFLCARNEEWDLYCYYIFLDNIGFSLSADEESMDMLIPHYRDSDIIKLELQCEPDPYDPYDD